MHTDRLIKFVQAMVQQPSLSGEERAVAERVEAEMRSLSYDSVEVDEVGNVVGVIEGAAAGKTLLFDAHTDTVGISPGVPWERDPFCADIIIDENRDEAIYGRGSADMKGALGAMVHAAAAVDRSTLSGRIVISASTLEEVLEGVALKVVMDRYPPDFVVIGEATDLNLARGGRGRAEVHLKTVGRPSHSSAPQLGRNAVIDMARVIQAIERLELGEDPLMGRAIIALTDIISDPYPGNSVIPSICRATYDRRLLPGETAEDVLSAIESLPGIEDIDLRSVIGIGEYEAYTGEILTWEKFFPAWLYPENEPFVQQSMSGLQAAGLKPDMRAYRFCTNAAYSAGIAGIPTIGFGPGGEHDAHVINERLKIDDLTAAARGYQGIIESVMAK
jgi:putative selenium metabolism hydrolase